MIIDKQQNEHYRLGRNDAIKEIASLVEPKKERPCDCDVCDCGNRDDAEAVAKWDELTATARQIRSLLDGDKQ